MENNALELKTPNTYHDILNMVNGLLELAETNKDIEFDLNKQVAIDIAKEKHKLNNAINNIDINEEIALFLNSFTSKVTIRSYSRVIRFYIEYCDSNNIDIFKANITVADSYIKHLMNKYSSSSVWTHYGTIASFYNYLIDRYPDIIRKNPFHKRKLPVIEDKFDKDVVTNKDIKELLKYFKGINRFDYITIIKLLDKHGFRIGFLEKMRIDKRGYLVTISKRQNIKVKLTAEEINNINKYKILELDHNTVGAKIREVAERLYKKGIVSCPFSAHDIRARVMNRDMKENGGDKFIKVSQKFHKNISTTARYIKRFNEGLQ